MGVLNHIRSTFKHPSPKAKEGVYLSFRKGLLQPPPYSVIPSQYVPLIMAANRGRVYF